MLRVPIATFWMLTWSIK